MDVRFTTAAAAYGQAAKRPSQEAAPSAAPSEAKAGFSALVKDAVAAAAEASAGAEAASLHALANPVDVTQVVLAVSNAEVALQTVVAVRDRVIAAYQDILKMPI
ncbi:MAG TPA: flagellar hook-basal body complex protein FliE [Alphaproteobacteria bacterium]|nr:flagellar hook-basal body complex protein FliE [Alphaproteobacteria bacterium]